MVAGLSKAEIAMLYLKVKAKVTDSFRSRSRFGKEIFYKLIKTKVF